MRSLVVTSTSTPAQGVSVVRLCLDHLTQRIFFEIFSNLSKQMELLELLLPGAAGLVVLITHRSARPACPASAWARIQSNTERIRGTRILILTNEFLKMM